MVLDLNPVRFGQRVIGRLQHEQAMLRRALIRRSDPVGDISVDRPPNLVISPGGVGTTFVMEHLSRFVLLNSPYDSDGLKHVPAIPEDWFERARVLYIAGDSVAVYASIERRDWTRELASKLGLVRELYAPGSARREALLQAIAAQDRFFRSASEQGKALIVAYDDIWDSVDDMAEWFAITDPAFVTEFPQRKPRASNVGG